MAKTIKENIKIVDVHVHVPNDCIEQIEDIHLLLEHMITKDLREKGSGIGIDVLDEGVLLEGADGTGGYLSTWIESPGDEQTPLDIIRDRDSLKLLYSVNRIVAENGNTARYLEDVLQIDILSTKIV